MDIIIDVLFINRTKQAIDPTDHMVQKNKKTGRERACPFLLKQTNN